MGKWKDKDVPKMGWTITDEEELSEAVGECEMCDKTRLRFLCIMKHPDFSEPVYVGTSCAQKMSLNYLQRRSIRKNKKDSNNLFLLKLNHKPVILKPINFDELVSGLLTVMRQSAKGNFFWPITKDGLPTTMGYGKSKFGDCYFSWHGTQKLGYYYKTPKDAVHAICKIHFKDQYEVAT